MQEKIQNMLNTKFDIEAIPEAKRSDEVDENEISDFGSEEADQVLPLAVEVEGQVESKEEAEGYIMERVETTVVTDMLKELLSLMTRNISRMAKVHQWLLMLVLRKRFLRKREAIPKM